MDPLATGDDGLSLQPSLDTSDLGGLSGGDLGAPEPDGTMTPDNSFFAAAPSIMPVTDPSPVNGFSGPIVPSAGGLLSGLASVWNAFTGQQTAQQQAAVAAQPLTQRLGLTDPSTGRLSQTGILVIVGGASLIALMFLRR